MTRINPVYHQTTANLQEEEAQIALAKQDPRHFEPIYNKYHEQIFRYIYQRTDDTSVAKDILSQVFLKALLNLHKYQFKGVPFSSWLYRIAKSEMNQWFRETKAQRVINVPMEALVHSEFADDQVQNNEAAREAMVEALRTLDENSLSLVEMRFFEQRSMKEIADILEITESNAKVRCFRAMKKLKETFNRVLITQERA